MGGIRVTVVDVDTGDTETVEIENDYLLICDGDRYVANTQVAVNTGTHVITVKKRKMDNE